MMGMLELDSDTQLNGQGKTDGGGNDCVSQTKSPTKRVQLLVKKRYHLIKYNDLPPHLKSNEYILEYYRSDWPLRETVFSLFSIHNETLNIWTHLLGFLIFLALAAYTATMLPTVVDMSGLPQMSSFQTVSSIVEENLVMMVPQSEVRITRWPFFVFLGGAMCCLLLSSTYHLLNCHSQRLHTILHRLDHAGIAVLIAASFYPPVYYSFLCNPVLRRVYLSGITLIGVMTILFSSLPVFRTPGFRKYRAMSFFTMGISGVIPGAHRMIMYWDEPVAFAPLVYEIAMGSLYGLGALLYATRIPERWKPGRFDIVGHSHQLFHVLVVIAALAHYKAGLIDLQWRDAHGCP